MRTRLIATALVLGLTVAGATAVTAQAKPGPSGLIGNGQIQPEENHNYCLATHSKMTMKKRGQTVFPIVYLDACNRPGSFNEWVVIRFEGTVEIALKASPGLCLFLSENQGNVAALSECGTVNSHGWPLRLISQNGDNTWKIEFGRSHLRYGGSPRDGIPVYWSNPASIWHTDFSWKNIP